MHVIIERKSSKVPKGFTGIFSTHAFTIDLQVTFTETELTAIKQAKLEEHILLERPYHDGYRCPVDDFQRRAADKLLAHTLIYSHTANKPMTVFYADTQPEADRAEDQLRASLKTLKAKLDQIVDAPRPQRDSFEL